MSVHQSRDVDQVQRLLTESVSLSLGQWAPDTLQTTRAKPREEAPARAQALVVVYMRLPGGDKTESSRWDRTGQADSRAREGLAASRLGFSPGKMQDGLHLDPSLRELEKPSATYTVTGENFQWPASFFMDNTLV